MDPIDFSKVVSIGSDKNILPAGYTQVDSITSSFPNGKGNDSLYVDTKISGINGCRVRGKFNVKAKDQLIYGARDNWTSNWFGCALSSEDDGGYFVFMPDGNNRFVSDLNVHFIDNNCSKPGYCMIDSMEPHQLSNINVSSNTLYLFNDHSSPGGEYSAEATIYSAEFYRNQILVCKPIPCFRNSDNVAGFYDIVNNRFLTKEANHTGVLTAGNIVNNEVTELSIGGTVIWRKE